MLTPFRAGGRRLAAVAASVVLAVSAGGCAVLDGRQQAEPSPSLSAEPVPDPPGTQTPEPDDALRDFYTQGVTWSECREGMECAEIDVPLDYAEPDGETITLSLLKVPALSRKERIGSLVINPGGPGGSGVQFAQNAETHFGREIRQVYDIVGFDPRGVGDSTPVDCLPDEELDEFVASDPDPDTRAERARADRLAEEFGAGCVERSGDLAAHVSTVEAAQDVDVIRAVVGDRRLAWFGASYGTLLGATYAELFPQRVGRMVLDGAIDPTLSNLEMSLVQARGFEVALRSYVVACVGRGGCFLGGSVDAGVERIQRFLAEVERAPLPTDGTRELTAGNAVLGIWAPLYNEGYWSILDEALRRGLEGDGTNLLMLSDAYTSRSPSGYLNNSLEALYAINCLDQDDAVSTQRAAELVPRFERVSPTWGSIFAYGMSSCSSWPVESRLDPGPLRAEGAQPILVVGTSRDPATPLAWAEALADQLDSGVLVRRDGDGHTGYNAGNACVDQAVEAYLVSGKVPKDGLAC